MFVDGKSGRGQSTAAKYLTLKLTAAGQLVLNCASTGQAGLQLQEGRTAHSLFGLPLDDAGKPVCNVGPRSERAALLKKAVLIQWDEFPLAKKQNAEAVLDLLENELQTPVVLVSDLEIHRDSPALQKHRKLARSLLSAGFARELKPDAEERRRLSALVLAPPTLRLREEERGDTAEI